MLIDYNMLVTEFWLLITKMIDSVKGKFDLLYFYKFRKSDLHFFHVSVTSNILHASVKTQPTPTCSWSALQSNTRTEPFVRMAEV